MRLLEIRCADPMFAWKEHDTITRMFHRFMSLNKAVGEAILYAGVECERFDSPTVLSLAIKYGLSLESQNPQGRTLLMLAALEGDDELVRCLVENGIGPKEYDRDNGGFTALMWAIKGAYLGIVQDLVSAGHGQLEARNHDRRTALMLAALWHRADITQYLVEFDQSQLDAKDKKGATPLMLALIGDLQTDFYTSPSNPEETDLVVGNKLGVPDKMTPAKEKCIANLETIVKVASQAQLNARDHQGRTALMRAIWPGRNSDVELTLKEVLCLMDNSLLDVEVRDNNGESAGAWIRQTMRRSNWLREDDELCSWEYMLEFIKMKLCETQDRPCLRTAEGLLSPKMAETETDW
ncbi:ankyrin repeat-containing domain protein [Podospora australis]|uniref:Ankyrin repeat-containing domain protein n=1 Tax=Podospora australis TaxID=1536484 RepID=A0AAN6WL90_9PEZI|nr:ankyrin repeat-containing domain protein [Podospora australis]